MRNEFHDEKQEHINKKTKQKKKAKNKAHSLDDSEKEELWKEGRTGKKTMQDNLGNEEKE